MPNFLSKIFGDANVRFLNKIRPEVEKINELEAEFEKLSSQEFKEKTQELKARFKGATLDELLPEAFALVREASKRTLKQRHFDEQLMGGIVLHQGKIGEMRTGEGKTLTATLAAYLNALSGESVHIVTVNDYLARRDTVWMGQIYDFLGLRVGCINPDNAYVYDSSYRKSETETEDQARDTLGAFKVFEDFLRPAPKKETYSCDIVYGTNTEFGFDYLRDNLVTDLNARVAPQRSFAIIDEVDSILIDEARTPLIISIPDAESEKLYHEFARIVPRLKENADYNIDHKMRTVIITDEGLDKVEQVLGLGNIYNERGIKFVRHLEQALRAQALFYRDKDYVVKNGQVIIVDEFTGRLLHGRRYSEGLHQAIEAKEGVEVQKESRTLATITFQNFFRLYTKLAGMTGTAATSAEEFHKVYGLDVVAVPTHKLMIRQDLADRIYKTEEAKFKAILEEIKERHMAGQPILVGTISIEKNEHLARFLIREGIKHEILNAKNHEREGAIIAQAGRLGALTIATNMAGRGVDIVLGGNPFDLKEAQKVRELGGLHVIGTERHEARRIDNQLRGRAGRQGDQGSSQFFVSLEDSLMRIFGGQKIKDLMERFDLPEDVPIENALVSKAIESAQAKIEGFNFDARKHILDYDDVISRQRATIYKKRLEILGGEASGEIPALIQQVISNIVKFHTLQSPTEWNREEIFENLKALLGVGPEEKEFIEKAGDKNALLDHYFNLAQNLYESRKIAFGSDLAVNIEKALMLNILDNLWMNHLEDMEYLRDSVNLRAYGQRDPLVEYKNESHRLFSQFLDNFNLQFVEILFKIQKNEAGVISLNQERKVAPRPARVLTKSEVKVGRNDPCPCGSGKKYKRCHGG